MAARRFASFSGVADANVRIDTTPAFRLAIRLEPSKFCTVPDDVTQLLNAIDSGDSQAADELLPLVYEELRRLAAFRMASESPGHTLQATALVHEA